MFEMFWMNLCYTTGSTFKSWQVGNRQRSTSLMDRIIKALAN